MSKVLQKLFIFWAIALPFVVWGGYYEDPKILYFYLGSFFVFLFWIIRILKFKKNFTFTKADQFYLLWIIILLISSFFGIHPFESIVGGSYRHQGVLFFFALWVVGKTVWVLDKHTKKLLVKTIAASVITESLVLLLQYIFGRLYFGKPLGSLGDPNSAAGFLGIGSYFIFDAFPIMTLILPFILIFLTESRAAILSLFPYLIKIKKRLWLLLIPLMLLGIFELSTFKGFSFFENRPTIWKLGIEKILQRPVLGYGAESGEAVYNLAFLENNTPLNSLIIDRAHNLFLDIVMWSGIVGLVPFLFWLWYGFKDSKNINFKLVFASFLLFSFFQPLSIVHWILMIITINI